MRIFTILSLCLLLAFTGCTSTTGDKPVMTTVVSGITLTTGAVTAYKTYSKVESIVQKYAKLFDQGELDKLKAINNEFRETFTALTSLKPDVATAEKLIVTVTYFDNIYNGVKNNYRAAKAIIYPKIDMMEIKDKLVLLNFDRDAVMIDKQIEKVREKIQTELANKNVNTVDITNALIQIASFAQTVSMLIAVL
jgi:hypothetical protein